MSRYMHDFKFKPDQDPLKIPQDYDVSYSREPTRNYPFLEYAESDCAILNSMGVHLPNGHYCQFEVENLGDNKFTILCKSHPEA